MKNEKLYNVKITKNLPFTLIEKEDSLVIMIKDSDRTYKKTLYIEEIPVISSFKSISELSNEICLAFEKEYVQVKEFNFEILFLIQGSKIKLFIPLETDAQSKMKEKIKEYEVQIAHLTKELNELKKKNNIKEISKEHQKKRFSITDFTLKKTIDSHTDWINCIWLLRDGRIASCSDDYSIKIHNISTYQCEATITVHSSIFYVSQLNDGCIVSACSDNAIRVWKLIYDKYTLVKRIPAHNDWVLKVNQISNDRMISCSNDFSVKIWMSKEPYELITTLQQHSSSINSVIELKNKIYLVSISEDHKAFFWDNSTYECKKILENIRCNYSNGLVEGPDNKVIAGGQDLISIINSLTLQLETKVTFRGIGSIYSVLSKTDDIILCGCQGGILMQIDFDGCEVKITKRKIHKDDIKSILFVNESTFLSSSFDCSIKIWEE